MPNSMLTMSRSPSAVHAAASQAAYEGAEDQADWDAHEATLDVLAGTSHGTLEAALEALRAVVADAIDCDLFGDACRAQQRVFQAALNVTEFAPSQAH